MKQLILGMLAILLPSLSVAQDRVDWGAQFYATDKAIFRYCPKDGSSWHDHQFDPRAYTEYWKKEIAVCDAFQLSAQNAKLLESQNAVYGFYMFLEILDEHSDSDYIRTPVGPFISLEECQTSFQQVQAEGVGAEPCKES